MRMTKTHALKEIDDTVDKLTSRMHRNTLMAIVSGVVGGGMPLILYFSAPSPANFSMFLISASSWGLGIFVANTAAACSRDTRTIASLIHTRVLIEQSGPDDRFSIEHIE